MAYTHITKEERHKIEALLNLDYSQTEIAEDLGKNKSAISQKISLNSADL